MENLTFNGRIRSFKFAFNGIRIMLCSQQNAWIHAFAKCVRDNFRREIRSDKIGMVLDHFGGDFRLDGGSPNTALEFLTDVAAPEFHPLAAKAKDVAAGAVLLTAIGAVLIGLLVFVPYLRGFGENLWR